MAYTKATGVHKIHSTFSTSGGVLSFYRDNASTQLAFGEDGTGLDVKFYGDTVSAYVLWDESANTLEVASGVTLNYDGTAEFSGNMGFFGKTAIAQASAATVASTVLINFGLLASV